MFFTEPAFPARALARRSGPSAVTRTGAHGIGDVYWALPLRHRPQGLVSR